MLRKIVKTRVKTISGGDVSGNKKATLHITEMPLVIPFAASYGTYENVRVSSLN